MAQPVATVTLGGTDISSYVASEVEGDTVTWGRGASFDGGTEAPGFATIIVKNSDKAFNPRNAGSTLTSVLKIGKPLRITATYSAVTYYLFHGYLRRIVPRSDGYAELLCEDALYNFSRRETSLLPTFGRQISEFRGAILDDIGESGSNRNLASDGPEATVTYSGADQQKALDILADLNTATGSVHYVKPTSTAYQYTTLARTALQSNASVETWSDTDFANPFATDLGGFDYTDERIINEQRVQARPRYLESEAVEVWNRGHAYLSAGQTMIRYAFFDDPTFSQALSYTVASGTASAALDPHARSSKITFSGGASGGELRDLSITGRRALEGELDSALSFDLTSQTAYGKLPGSEISSEYIHSETWSQALGDWYVYRYKDPRANPPVTFEDRFTTQLVREIGDRVTVTSTEMSLTAVEMVIRAFKTSIHSSGHWRTEYQLEEMPAAISLFTIGGSAAQGVGGTGILAY